MISREELRKLATLCRLNVPEDELEALRKEFSTILDYVSQVSAVSAGEETDAASPRNVMREDAPYDSGHPMSGKRERLLSEAPRREGDYVVVRKIIDRER